MNQKAKIHEVLLDNLVWQGDHWTFRGDISKLTNQIDVSLGISRDDILDSLNRIELTLMDLQSKP